MSALFLACSLAFQQIEDKSFVMAFVEERFQYETRERIWIEQCVARKAAGL